MFSSTFSLETELEEAAVDNCLERVYATDAEAAESIRSEAGMALKAVLALEAVVDAL